MFCCGGVSGTSVSLEGGDEIAAVLLQFEDGHLTRLVSDESVPGLHIKPGIRLLLKKKKVQDTGERLR